MARDPADRYPSGAEFGRALDRAQRASDEPTTLVMLHAPPRAHAAG